MKMLILLITDGDFNNADYFKDLSRFFSCKHIEMSKVSSSDLSEAELSVVDLKGASPTCLKHLRAVMSANKGAKIVCPLTKGDRWEMVQSGTLGQVKHFDRAKGFKALVLTIREFIGKPDCDLERLQNSSKEVQQAFHKSAALLDDLPFAASDDGAISVALMKQSASALTGVMQEEGISAWLGAVECHHSHTFRHSLYVAGLVTSFAQSLGWSSEHQTMIAAGGLLHDIGKTKIPLAILDKPGALTDEEFDTIKKHPLFGEEILQRANNIPNEIKRMAVCHHEYIDGSGYPYGLSGDQLGPTVRVMTICDIFAAMTEERSYKSPMSPRVAFANLIDMGGKLDQSLVKKFKDIVMDLHSSQPNRSAAVKRAPVKQAKAS